jgi:hypothetical protein
LLFIIIIKTISIKINFTFIENFFAVYFVWSTHKKKILLTNNLHHYQYRSDGLLQLLIIISQGKGKKYFNNGKKCKHSPWLLLKGIFCVRDVISKESQTL